MIAKFSVAIILSASAFWLGASYFHSADMASYPVVGRELHSVMRVK